MRDYSSWEAFGLRGERPTPDLKAVLANSARVTRYAHDKKDLSGHLADQGVRLIEGIGDVSFVDPTTVTVSTGRTWTADRVIVAVGGRPARPPIPGAELTLDYNDLHSLATLPRETAVIGGSDTGCQIASILAEFGSNVEIFEAGGRLVPQTDEAISHFLCGAFGRRGIKVHLQTTVDRIETGANKVRLTHHAGSTTGEIDVDATFCAVGWVGNVEPLELARAGVWTDRHMIPVDDYLRTNVGHIFAAGDVNGRSMLVQTARLEGRIAAQNAIAGPTREVSYDVVPTASFTDPEYGRVGLTEADARMHRDVVVGVASYDDLLRPVADGRPEGFCKLVVDSQSRTVLGAHVIGEYSAEVIQMVAACMASGMRIEQIAELQLAFPTFTEGVSMAAQKVCRTLGVGDFPQAWSDLGDR
jgi:pyruvate/2-oxoglutarate dehydrogenase complex dihydrolipoamide dehydrogenase (E3) component